MHIFDGFSPNFWLEMMRKRARQSKKMQEINCSKNKLNFS